MSDEMAVPEVLGTDELIVYLDRELGLRNGMTREQRLEEMARIHAEHRRRIGETVYTMCEFGPDELRDYATSRGWLEREDLG